MSSEITFLEQLGIADMEKIHSQIISFIFNDSCDCISKEDKLKILNNVFLAKDSHEIYKSSIKSYTEYKSIDILIISESYIFVIENKLKSNQHSKQLSKYRRTISEEDQFKHLQPIWCFLTFVGEKAKDEVWDNVSYESFYDFIKSISLKQNSRFKPFIEDYITYLGNLIETIKTFDESPSEFNNVFTDAMKKKYEKLKILESNSKLNHANYTEVRSFITRNNLEKILQYRFYFKKISPMVEEMNLIPELGASGKGGNITMHINFDELYTSSKGIDFRFGFQYDERLIKYCFLAKEYNKVLKKDLPKEVIKYFEKYLVKKRKYGKFSPAKTKTFMNVKIPYKIEENTVLEIQEELKRKYLFWHKFYTDNIIRLFECRFKEKYWDEQSVVK